MATEGYRALLAGVERRVVDDERGGIQAVTARVGCAKCVLARRGAVPGRMVMIPRDLAFARLAEIDGTIGGLLTLAYDQTLSDLVEAGFSISHDTLDDFLQCTEKGKNHRSRCLKLATCPWRLRGESYLPGECPYDRWKSIRH
jgi:hypothetical protein